MGAEHELDESVRLTHIGGPTVLLEFGGARILTDPTFDPPGRRYRFGWGTSSTKVGAPALDAAQLGRIDAVLVTHDHHADNLDDAGRRFLADVPIVVTTQSGASRLGRGAIGLRAWDRYEIRTDGGAVIGVQATPCRHGPRFSHPIVGDVVGFALTTPGRPGAVWVSGDTVNYDGVREVAERVDVDVAVMHVGEVRFRLTGPLRYTMGIADAIEIVGMVKPRVAVPVHYEGWSHFSEGESAVRSALSDPAGVIKPPFRLLERGVATELG